VPADPNVGGEGKLNQPLGTSSPSQTIRREEGGDGDGFNQTKAMWHVSGEGGG